MSGTTSTQTTAAPATPSPQGDLTALLASVPGDSYAQGILGPQNQAQLSAEGGFQGYTTGPGPTVPAGYGAGLNLNTSTGLNDLASEVAFQNPNALYVEPNAGGNAAYANEFSWLSSGAPGSPSAAGVANQLIPTAGNPLYTQNPDGSLSLDQSGLQDLSLGYGQAQGVTPNASPFLVSLPVELASLGAAGYGLLGADAAASAASADAATYGAGDLSGAMAADLPSAGAGGATGAGAGALGAGVADVSGFSTADYAAMAADLPSAGAGNATGIAAGPLGTASTGAVATGGVADLSGLSGYSGATAGTTAGATRATDLGGFGPGAASDQFIGSAISEPAATPNAGGGFWSDLTSGNFSQAFGNDLPGETAATPQTSTFGTSATTSGYSNDLIGRILGAAPDASTGPIEISPGAAGVSGAGGDSTTFLGKLAAGLNDPYKLLGLGAAGVGLGMSLSKAGASNPIPGMSNISTIAGSLAAQGNTLAQYLQSGTLPTGVQASLDQATNSAIAAVRSNFASRGIPPGSTMEQQQIAAIQQNAAAQGGQLALNLLNQGVQESNMSAELYGTLLQANTQLNAQTGQAIGNLASALAGGNNKITVTSSPGTTVS